MASIRIGRIAGTPVKVDWGLAVAAAVFTFALAFQIFPAAAPDATTGQRLVTGTITATALLLCVLAHELGHVAAARHHEVPTGPITLSLLGGYAQLEDLAPTPRADVSIGVAGAAVNLVLAALFAAGAAVQYSLSGPGNLVLAALSWLTMVNLLLGVLNLFPALPLDGGRVLAAIIWWRTGERDPARVTAGRIGLIVGIATLAVGPAAMALGHWEGLLAMLIGWFLIRGAKAEIVSATIRNRLLTLTVQDRIAGLGPQIGDRWTAAEFLARSDGRVRELIHPVVRWGVEPIGYMLPSQLDAIAAPEQSWTEVSDIMVPADKAVRAWTVEPLDDVLRRGWKQPPLLIVVHDPDTKRVVGGLSSHQIEDLLEPPDFWGRDRTPEPADQLPERSPLAGLDKPDPNGNNITTDRVVFPVVGARNDRGPDQRP